MERRNCPLPQAGSRILRVSAGRPGEAPKSEPLDDPDLPAPSAQHRLDESLGQRRGRVEHAVAAPSLAIDLEAQPVSGAAHESMPLAVRVDPPDRVVLRCAARDDRQEPADQLLDLRRAQEQASRPWSGPSAGSRRRMRPGLARSEAPAQRRSARRGPSSPSPEPSPANRRARGCGTAHPNEPAPARGCSAANRPAPQARGGSG